MWRNTYNICDSWEIRPTEIWMNWYRRKERDGNILKNLWAYPYVKITFTKVTTKEILLYIPPNSLLLRMT